MMIVLLVLAQSLQAGSTSPPASCKAAEQASWDNTAGLALPSKERPYSAFGVSLLEAQDRLGVAMRASPSDLAEVQRRWTAYNALKLEGGRRYFDAQLACKMDQLRAMPAEQRKEALRVMSPPTRQEREEAANRKRIVPAPPPQPAPSPSPSRPLKAE